MSTAIQALDPGKAITQYIHETWGIEKGLEQKDIYSIIQTRDHYLWLGTSEGLLRFDGYRFQLFNKSNIENLRQSFISTFLESRDGTLWIGSYGGGLIRFQEDRFTVFSSDDGLSNNLVRSLAEGKDGSIWVGSFGGIDRFSQGRFDHFSMNEGLPSNNVKALCVDGEGTLWAGTANGLSRFQNGRFIPVAIPDRSGKSRSWFVNEIREAHDGGLWVCLHGGGLVFLKNGSSRVYTSSDGLSNDFILSSIEDRDGNLWLGTLGGGLNRFSKGSFVVFSHNDGLTNDSVFALYEDSDGSIWASTTGSGGLNRFREGKFLGYTKREGLWSDQVWSLAEGRDGSIWIGSQAGLNRWREGGIEKIAAGGFLRNQVVRSVIEGRDGRVWIGTEGAGLGCLQNGRTEVRTTGQGLSHDIVWSLLEDRSGKLWVGTDDGLTTIFAGAIKRYTQRDGLPSAVIRAIYQSRNGTVWLGTNGGLAAYRTGEFIVYTVNEGLSLNMVRSIFESRDGDLWIGTLGGGLNRLRNGKFTVFSMKEGLAADEIWSIQEDSFGYLWMSCNRGIFRVREKDLDEFAENKLSRLHCDFFGYTDGLRGGCGGGSAPGACIAGTGTIWFPTLNGVIVIDPKRIPVDQTVPPVRIEEVKLNNREYSPGEAITVPPGRGNLEFQYTAFSFLNPEAVNFRYRLEGFDPEWIEAGNRRTAYFTNIPPGRYRFHVTAGNNNGLWNEQGAMFDFELRPFFTQTIWFYSLCILMALGLVAGFFRMREQRMKARERELTRLVEERTEELHHTMEKLETANVELERLTLTDKLTDITNRRGFENALNLEWLRCLREQKPLSLIMIDIDFFKNFNDSHGHLDGDECLKRVAEVLAGTAKRPGDSASRYGGEEFVVLLPATDGQGAMALAEQMRTRIEALSIPHPDSRCASVLTISLGIATVVPASGFSQEMLIAVADQALYQAKKEGRNRVAATDLSAT